MIEFKMPALGSDMDEGTLNEWLVKPGDTVTRGQVVAVVETTKAAVEVECWHDGIVHELLVPIGETVQVGTALATLLAPGETAEAAPARVITPTEAPAAVEPAGAAEKPTAAAGPATTPRRRRWVSPAARRVAASLGVDVDAVTGTGPQGAVTINDVEHAAASAKKPETKPTATDRAAQMRKSIAAAMSRSKREIPHYYLADEIPMEKALSMADRAQCAATDHRTRAAGRAAVEGRCGWRHSGSASSTDSGATTAFEPAVGRSRRGCDLDARRRACRPGHP